MADHQEPADNGELGQRKICHHNQPSPKGRPIIFVLGGPGSGKGTQCDKIVRDFGYLHLSAGDLLRDEVKNGTEIGRECEQLMKDGKLVPVEVTLKLIKKAMKESKDGATGFLIDGFPRALEQAEEFEKKVGRPKLVVFLECPKEEMEKRLLKRGETSGRSDDNMATILKRFETFLQESLPVVKYYDNLQPGLVIKVSSVPPPDDVYKEIYCAILGFRGEMENDPMCAALLHSDSCDRLSFA